jgi:hypothetical protein
MDKNQSIYLPNLSQRTIKMKKITLNFVLYFILIVGFILLHIFDIEVIVFGEKYTKPSSKVNFVYEQF